MQQNDSLVNGYAGPVHGVCRDALRVEDKVRPLERRVVLYGAVGAPHDRVKGLRRAERLAWPSARLSFCCIPPLPLVGVSIGIERGCHQNHNFSSGATAHPSSSA